MAPDSRLTGGYLRLDSTENRVSCFDGCEIPTDRESHVFHECNTMAT